MRVVSGKTVVTGDMYDVVKAEYAKMGYKYEQWTVEYWLLYEVNDGKASVHLFMQHAEMLAYMESKKDDYNVHFEILQERKILSEARKVVKEQLAIFLEGK